MGLRFSVGNLRVSFSFWFFCVIALFSMSDHHVLAWYIALPIIIHEIGHVIIMFACGAKIQAIEFTPISINIQRYSSLNTSMPADIAINLGGIAANILVALWLYLYKFQSIRIIFLVSANLVVALFNLLPIGNLDGGVVCKIICERFFLPDTAHSISKWVSLLVLTPLFAGSLFMLLSGIGNFTLILTCVYLAITVIFRE